MAYRPSVRPTRVAQPPSFHRFPPKIRREARPGLSVSSYALGPAINVVGSAKVPLSLAGDGQQPISIWLAENQKQRCLTRLPRRRGSDPCPQRNK